MQLVEENAETPTQLISFQDQIKAWCTFYSSLGAYRDELCVAPFDVVVEDMGRVIGQMNDRLGTNFARFDHTEEAVAEVHAGQGYHSGPSERRARLKEETGLDFDEKLRTDPSLRKALSTAESLYDEFASGEG
ncbi:hypothetical protein [Salinibacter ruber]|uniref:hypothetical protein n=1 Tax=Salinibacter ruber TaxID=146919 RepID=UPI00216825EF|nr:hypothetical protein [Salinibacter ruber]MCS4188203.1 hypothetical protein [Salinibacter ruber]